MTDGDPYRWSSATIGSILRNPVYTGDLILLKTEIVNHKTGQSAVVPEDRRVVIPNAHEAIISREIFEQAVKIRAEHRCPDGEREPISGIAFLRLLRSSTDPVPEETEGSGGGHLPLHPP